MDLRERFCEIFKAKITRDGSDRMLEYLTGRGSDFFTSPASAKYHCSYEGGLCEHSLNVYDRLCDYLARGSIKKLGLEATEETAAIVALLHDVCKINTYRVGSRNVKDAGGVWRAVPYYEYADELPYGHGEKSVYIINGYMRLTREEAFAIRWHMGFSGDEDKRKVGDALERYPLAMALFVADMEATFLMEKETPVQ